MLKFSTHIRVRMIAMLLLVTASSNTGKHYDTGTRFLNNHFCNSCRDQCRAKSNTSLAPINNASELTNCTVNSVKPIPEEGSSLMSKNISLRITDRNRKTDRDNINSAWRTRSLCAVSASTNRKRTLLDDDGPVIINDVEDSLHPDSLAVHIRVKRHGPRSNTLPSTSDGPSYLKDLANSFPRSFPNNDMVYDEKGTKKTKSRSNSIFTLKGLKNIQPAEIVPGSEITERTFAESSEIFATKIVNYTNQLTPKIVSLKERHNNPTLVVDLIRRKRNNYAKIQTADNDDDLSSQHVRNMRGLPENMQRRRSVKRKRRNRKKHSKKKQTNRKKPPAKVAERSSVHRKGRKGQSKSNDALRSQLVNKDDLNNNLHSVNDINAGVAKSKNVHTSLTQSSSKYNEPYQISKLSHRSVESRNLNDNSAKIASGKIALGKSLKEGSKLRMKRDQSAHHASRKTNTDELKYYEDVREPESTSAPCINQDGAQISDHPTEDSQASKSIAEVKLLTEKLVAKVNELQTYLSNENKEGEKGEKKINARAIDDLCSNVSTVCAVFEKTPKIVQRCAPSTNVEFTTPKAMLERAIDFRASEEGNGLLNGKNRPAELRGAIQRDSRSSVASGATGKRDAKNKKTSHKWGRWTDWSGCSVTCGKGRQIRWRFCLHDCSTAETEMEEKACQMPACPPGKFLGIF